MTARWSVHLSPDSASALRSLSRGMAGRVADALDALAHDGPASLQVERDGGEWTGSLAVGEHVITVAGREGDERIVVVRIDAVREHRAHRTLDALPLRYATRRALASVVLGAELDLRYTWRTLRRTPLFTAAVVATLAIGFGGAGALLDIVHTVYGSALPFGESERLVRVRNVNTAADGEVQRYNLTPDDFEFLRAQNRSFTEVVAMVGRSISLVDDGPAERVSAIGVSPNWARTLRIQPALGRTFVPDEEVAGRDASVALISYALWQRRFGGDSSVVGRALPFDGGSFRVVGVLPRGFAYPYDADVWTPWTFLTNRNAPSSLNVVARLSEGATVTSARTDADRMHADRAAANLHRSANAFEVVTVRSDFIRDEARTLHVLSAAVLFLLVLACVNVANLLVARFTTRRAELGLRAALGGRRDQQIRQMLFESLLLFAAGVAASMFLANALRRVLSVTVPDTFRTELGYTGTRVGVGVAGVTLAVAVLCGLIIGVVAAARALRTGPMSLVRQGDRAIVGRSDRRIFDVLVASQLSFSLVLLVGAALLIGRFRDLTRTHPGYELEGVATMRITIEQERYQHPDARYQLVHSIEERLRLVPGVEAVGITTVNPLCCGDWGAPVEIEGRPRSPDEPALLVAHSYVTPGYFDAMRIPVLQGAEFDRTDRPGGAITVIVDQALAEMAWPGQSVIGKRIRLARANQPWRTVVGVVPVTEHEAEMRASWFLPYYQEPMGGSTEQLHVMIRRSPSAPLESLRDAVARIDPALAVYAMTTMESLQRERTAQDRLGAIVSGVFALFGLLLAGVSLYGLMSYSVEVRARELGIRMALGAGQPTIVKLIMRQAVLRLLIGTAVGVALALGMNQVLRGAIEGLPWVSWPTLLALVALMAAVTAAAAAAPALRAIRIDPGRALRA